MRRARVLEACEGAGWIIGTAREVVARLRELEQAGVEHVFLQYLAHDDVELVTLLGAEVVPAVAA